MKNKITLLLAASVSLMACSKKQTEPSTNAQIGIDIISPEDGRTFHKGDTMNINCHMTYNNIMHGYELSVVDTATNQVLFDYAEHVHSDSFTVLQIFVPQGSSTVVMKVTLRTEIDHNGTEAEKQVICIYQP